MEKVSKLFRAYRLYNDAEYDNRTVDFMVSKLFRAYVLYNYEGIEGYGNLSDAFQSSFELTGYITGFQLMIL